MRKQTFAHIACVYVFIVIGAATLLPIVLGTQQQHFPADYLVPPPLPTPQHLRHQNAPTHQTAETVAATSQTSVNAVEPPGFMSRVARWFGLGAADQNQIASDGKQAYNYAQPLGADGKPCNQCNKYPWVPMFPQALQYPPAAVVGNQNTHQSSVVPQHQSNQHYEAQASQKFVQQQPLPFGVGKAQLPVKQRAVQFNFPTIYQAVPGSYKAVSGVAKAPVAPPPFLPLHIPKLNLNALPPIYNAQPFRVPYLTPVVSTTTTTTPSESSLGSVQQLPTTEPAHFAENIGSHSELQADRVRPAQTHSTPARNPDPSFEIVKSHQITDFVSSVEYPITFEQSPSIDLGQQHIPAIQETPKETVATVPYQHETLSPNLHKHLPASQILTELGSFADKQQPNKQNQLTQQTQSYPDTQTQWQTQSQTQPQPAQQHQHHINPQSDTSYHTATQQQQQQQYTQTTQSQSQSGYTPFHQSNEQSTTFYTTPYQSQSQYPQHNYTPPGTTYEPHGDNFPSASSHNLTQLQGQQQNLNYKPWLPLTQSFVYTTTEPPRELELSTQLTQLGDVDYLTERVPGTTQVQYSPSMQTFAQHRPELVKDDSRDTPKRLLDSPILHAHGFPNQPRPFTRDPSELNLRQPAANFVTADIYPNHKQNSGEPSYSTAPWLVTPLPPLPAYTNAPAAPTPTSTYSALDASGQYAGMSPPNPPAPARHKDVHQIIIPYTTKNQPRPFEPTRPVTEGNQHVQFSNAAYHKWSAQHNSVDIHEQQESKLVTAKLATETPPTPHEPPRRTTKYVTKILASNLRDLLRREHDVRKHKSNSSFGFDLSKLQKNIDDWTVQEYTSLSHRASTPTIRGRSKHIPTEYLTTTTPSSSRRPKTTLSLYDPSSELPASVNDLQSLLLERGSKRLELNQINDEIDNRLLDTLESETATLSSTATTSYTTTTQHSTHSNGHAAPNFMHLSADSYQPETEPAELWRKAKVSISPQTHEKVYVVTPQPRFFPQRTLTTTSTSTEVPISLRKSPRFVVRPTPGNGTNSQTSVSNHSQTSVSNHYSSELFGLRGLSAYVPAKPVEIIDGNSKVFNIATSAPDNQVDYTTTKPAYTVEKASLTKKGRRLRSTMSPSPR